MPFATYPSVVMYDKNGKPVQHLIFGDFITSLNERNGEKIKVRSRGEEGWIRESEMQDERILEVNFVDVGQGDGCHIVTPEDKVILVDAGVSDHMYSFLSWRYNLFRKKEDFRFPIEKVIITHPDKDHYYGFNLIFNEPKLITKQIYHNGIVERANDETKLGETSIILDEGRNRKHLSGLIEDTAAMVGLLRDPTKLKTSPKSRRPLQYPTTLLKAYLKHGDEARFSMLSSTDGYLPGYEEDKPMSLKILGPVAVENGNKRHLRYLSNDGKTKNGHSVIFLLTIRKLKIILGGDLNTEAENYLISHYTQTDPTKLLKEIQKAKTEEKKKDKLIEYENMIAEAQKVFGADIQKACHHGSHHFTKEYLRATHSIATIISSGDDESYAHPRPDALGAFGKYGRGDRPLIFSTELARSTKELFTHPEVFRKKLDEAYRKIAEAKTEDSRKTQIVRKDKLLRQIERSVAIYGMITVRTDGEKVIIAQKLERQRSKGDKWDIHELVLNKEGEFEYRE